MDIKENLAENLVAYRKAANITQAELAEKLNYTNKAVSKWERGESVPDLYVLKQIADFYNVKIDTLIAKPKSGQPKVFQSLNSIRSIICLCSVGLVWLIAALAFVCLNILTEFDFAWLFFIYALPISFIILLVLTAVWRKPLTNTIIISLLIWSTLLAIYLSFSKFLITPPSALWMIFLVGIPAQALTIFWFLYRQLKKKK